MISKGDVLHNPVTGEILRFVETAADTDGAYTLVEAVVAPGGFVAAAHLHPYQRETFTVVEGTVAFKADGQEIVAGPGDTVIVDAGASHKFWNVGETDAVFRCKIEPALQFERLIETMFALARDGKTNKKACRTRFAGRHRERALGRRAASRSRRPGCRSLGSRSVHRSAARLPPDVRAEARDGDRRRHARDLACGSTAR